MGHLISFIYNLLFIYDSMLHSHDSLRAIEDLLIFFSAFSQNYDEWCSLWRTKCEQHVLFYVCSGKR